MSIIEKLLPDLNSRLTAQGFYLEMLEALIEIYRATYSNRTSNPAKMLAYQKVKDTIEKACYPKKWEEIRSYYE